MNGTTTQDLKSALAGAISRTSPAAGLKPRNSARLMGARALAIAPMLLAASTLAATVTPVSATVYRTAGGSGTYSYSLSARSVPVSLWVTKDAGGQQSVSGWVRFFNTPTSNVPTPWTKLGECVTLGVYGVNGVTCKFAGTMSAPNRGWYRVQVAYGWYRVTGWEYLYETSAWFYMN